MLSLDSMKFVDAFVGRTLCFTFTQLARVKHRVPAAYPAEVRKALIIKFWGMGSIVLASPAVEKLKKKYPGCHVSFLTFEFNRAVCEMIPSVDEIITIPIHGSFWSFAKETLSVILRLRREKFDFLADFEFFTRFSALITFLSGAKVKAGFHAWEAYRGNLHDILVPFNYYWHVIDNFINLATGDGFSRNAVPVPRLRVPHEAEGSVSTILREQGVLSEDTIFVINPNAGELALERRWPREYFVQLVRMLEKKYHAKILLIGGSSEEEYTLGIAKEADIPAVVSLAGRLTIKQLATLLSKADLMITNDSGPLHLACALGVKTISFFGPETPVLYGPSTKSHHVFYKNISCSPCINVHNTKTARCRHGHPDCLELIGVDEVLEAVESLLAPPGDSTIDGAGRTLPGQIQGTITSSHGGAPRQEDPHASSKSSDAR